MHKNTGDNQSKKEIPRPGAQFLMFWKDPFASDIQRN